MDSRGALNENISSSAMKIPNSMLEMVGKGIVNMTAGIFVTPLYRSIKFYVQLFSAHLKKDIAELEKDAE